MCRNWNLCCNYSLKSGSSAVGYGDIFVQIVGVIVYAYAVFSHSEVLSCLFDTKHEYLQNCTDIIVNTTSQYHEILAISSGSWGVLIRLVQLAIALMLVQGAKQRNEKRLHMWFLLTAVLTGLDATNFLTSTIFLEQDKMVMGYAVPNLVYKLYSLGVVRSYETQLKSYVPVSGVNTESEQTTNEPQ